MPAWLFISVCDLKISRNFSLLIYWRFQVPPSQHPEVYINVPVPQGFSLVIYPGVILYAVSPGATPDPCHLFTCNFYQKGALLHIGSLKEYHHWVIQVVVYSMIPPLHDLTHYPFYPLRIYFHELSGCKKCRNYSVFFKLLRMIIKIGNIAPCITCQEKVEASLPDTWLCSFWTSAWSSRCEGR
jgi:hypothetical protein